MSKKRIMLAITHGRHTRLLLHSGFLDRILQAPDVEVAILAPNAEEKQFRDRFERKCVLRRIGPQSVRLLDRLGSIRRKLLLGSKASASHRILLEDLRLQHPVVYWCVRVLNALTRRFSGFNRLIIAVDRAIVRDRLFRPLFRELKPDLLVVCSLVHNEAFHLLRRAKAEGVKVVYIVESWDNPTCKLSLFDRPDSYLVWNEIMKAELVKYHNVEPLQVHVTGSAHHDIYARKERINSRETVARRYNMDPNARWIVVTATLDYWCQDFEGFLRKLHRAQMEGRFGRSQILVRPHPQAVTGFSEGPSDRSLGWIEKECKGMFVDRPEVASRGLLVVDMKPEDSMRLAEMLFHANVVVSFFSTTIIDACAMGAPVVVPAIDEELKIKRFVNLRRCLSLEHIRNVLATGAVRIAHTMEDVIVEISNYLEARHRDSVNRKRLVEQQCGIQDGNASIRMADAVLAECGIQIDASASVRDVTFGLHTVPEQLQSGPKA